MISTSTIQRQASVSTIPARASRAIATTAAPSASRRGRRGFGCTERDVKLPRGWRSRLSRGLPTRMAKAYSVPPNLPRRDWRFRA